MIKFGWFRIVVGFFEASIVLLRIVRCILGAVLAFGCLLGLYARRVANCWSVFGDVNRKGA